jgi:hypothetical protein
MLHRTRLRLQQVQPGHDHPDCLCWPPLRFTPLSVLLLLPPCCCCRYGLGTHFLTHLDFKAGLEEYLQQAGTAAIVLGTRRCGSVC